MIKSHSEISYGYNGSSFKLDGKGDVDEICGARRAGLAFCWLIRAHAAVISVCAGTRLETVGAGGVGGAGPDGDAGGRLLKWHIKSINNRSSAIQKSESGFC